MQRLLLWHCFPTVNNRYKISQWERKGKKTTHIDHLLSLAKLLKHSEQYKSWDRQRLSSTDGHWASATKHSHDLTYKFLWRAIRWETAHCVHMCLEEKNESLPTLDQAGDVRDWQGEWCRQRLCFLKSTESHPRKKHKKESKTGRNDISWEVGARMSGVPPCYRGCTPVQDEETRPFCNTFCKDSWWKIFVSSAAVSLGAALL